MNADARDSSLLGDPIVPGEARVAWSSHAAQAWRDRYRIGLVLLAGFALTALVAAMATKRYTAEASLLLRLGREYLYTPEVGDNASRTPLAYDREQTIQSETRILLSRDVLESAVVKLGVARIYPKLASAGVAPDEQRAKAMLAIEKALDAELLKGTNLMQVQFKHDDPQVAALTLSALIEAYLAKRQLIFASPGFKSTEADFKAQEAKLQAAEAHLAAFKRQWHIRAFVEEQSLLLAQRSALELKQSDVSVSLAQASGRASTLQGRLSKVPAEVTLSSETQRSDAAESTLKLLMDLKLKERDASAKFADTEPEVQDVRQDIALAMSHLKDLKANPPRTVKVGRSPVRDAAESEFERALADQGQAKAGQSSVAARLADIDQRLNHLTDHEREWQTLERVRRLAEADYEAAAKRLRDERILADLDRQRQSSVSVVQAPKAPLEGKSARAAIVGVGSVLTLAAAMLTAFLCALWRQTIPARSMAWATSSQSGQSGQSESST